MKCVLFDLDGTLLPLDQDEFIAEYFKVLRAYIAERGILDEAFFPTFRRGIHRMVKNDGKVTNEEAFWDEMESGIPSIKERLFPILEDFYENEFDKIVSVTRPSKMARELVDFCHSLGLSTVLATSPIFPKIATEKRMAWVGLNPSDFLYVTTYENSSYSKPYPGYYTTLCEKVGYSPKDCLMVGNDALDDLGAENIGIPVFLLMNDFLNRNGIDVSSVPQGNQDDLKAFILEKCK
jgi:FMN phosphatase YigB (HAD superfamily)